MANVPVIRDVTNLAVLLQLAIAAVFVAIASFLRGGFDPSALMTGAAAYLAVALTLRYTVTRQHRAGFRLMKAGELERALPYFERSAAYFAAHPRIDRFRAITLLSAAQYSYREMALCNLAFGLAQLGRGAEAKAAYARVLREYPRNAIANAAMRLIVATEAAS